MKPLVSVIIPAYNEENEIGACLESIRASDYPNLEIIVVDDNSKDRTAKVASMYTVRLIRRPSRGGIASARNDGLSVARGEIVAFVDADCTVDKNWLNLLVEQYTDDKIAGVGGPIRTRKSGLIASYRTFKERERWADSGAPIETLLLPGGNSSFRTEVLRKIGGFDPGFAQPRGYEQFELCYRLGKNGYRLIGEPNAIVWHVHEDSLMRWAILAFETGYSSLSIMFDRETWGDFLGRQLILQFAYITLLMLFLATITGFVPPITAIDIAGVVLFLEVMREAYYVMESLVHYRDPKYVAMLPVEIVLRILNFAGFAWALLVAILSAPFRLKADH